LSGFALGKVLNAEKFDGTAGIQLGLTPEEFRENVVNKRVLFGLIWLLT